MNRAWIWGLLVAGCGGQCPEAASASSAPGVESEAPASSSAAEPSEGTGEKSSTASAREASPAPGDSSKAESGSKADVGPNPWLVALFTTIEVAIAAAIGMASGSHHAAPAEPAPSLRAADRVR